MAIGLGCTPQQGPSVAKAIDLALDQARASDLVLITGSLFVVAEAREHWLRNLSQSTPRSTVPSNDPPGVY